MSLGLRLVLAFVFVAIGATALWGWRVRATSRELLLLGFDQRIEAAVGEVGEALEVEAGALERLTHPLCKRGTFFDRALVDLERAKGDPSMIEAGSRIAMRYHVPDEAAARDLDELALVTGQGTIVAASDVARIGERDARLGELVRSAPAGKARLRPERAGRERSIEVWCAETRGPITLGLVASRRIDAILARVGRAHGVSLSPLGDEAAAEGVDERRVVRTMHAKQIEGLAVVAVLPKDSLLEALDRLDREILASLGLAVAAALVVALLLARSLARPILELAHETREVVAGEPRPVKGRGGKEIAQLAASFNHTIEELTKMRKRLAATERIAARREIARQVAHEIKNPLAPIRAAVETLRRLRAREDPAFDEYFDEATRTVLEEVHRIANIVGEFTRFSRLPAPDPRPFDLVDTLRGLVALHAAVPEGAPTGQGQPRVELAIESELPDVRADRDQIVQVMTNLVQNGLEAASAVRSDPRVLVSLRRLDEQRLRIVVRDNGPGVAEEMRERLFEPYATSKATGTGLGLAICQRIVFEHGGEIGYRPATKGGAVFEITLPIDGPSLLDKPLETTAQPVTRSEVASAADRANDAQARAKAGESS
jgi:signal transduction histidine kinase